MEHLFGANNAKHKAGFTILFAPNNSHTNSPLGYKDASGGVSLPVSSENCLQEDLT